MPDVRAIREYLHRGCPHGEPIVLSFGETWTQSPLELSSLLSRTPRHAHGYQLSMYGLPALREILRERVAVEHRLPSSEGWDLAASWTGTRSVMFDYARAIAQVPAARGKRRIALAVGPSWDYAGVFAPLGFEMRYLHVRPEDDFQPRPEVLASLLHELDADARNELALVVVNAQHNPTGANWSETFVRALLSAAIERGAHVLIDDAYYAVHDPDVVPTSALAIMLELLGDAPPAARTRWIDVRSLGKQFHCNGWGLGAIVADPAILEDLVNRTRLQHQLMYGGILQEAMEQFLRSPGCDRFLRAQREGYREKRDVLRELLTRELGHPARSIHLGVCTSYAMVPVPRIFESAPERFVPEVFARTGVLIAPPWPWPYGESTRTAIPFARVFLGPELATICEAFERIRDAGLGYEARPARASELSP